MICNKCGKEIPQGMIMCPNCGAIVESYDLNLGDSLNTVNFSGMGGSMNLQNGMNQSAVSEAGMSQQMHPVQGFGTGGHQQYPAMEIQQTASLDSVFGDGTAGVSSSTKENGYGKGRSLPGGGKPRIVSEMDSFGRRIKTDHVGIAIIFCALLTTLGVLLPVLSDNSSAISQTQYIMLGYGIGKISVLAAILCLIFKVLQYDLAVMVCGFFAACMCLLSVITAKESVSKGEEAVKAVLSVEIGYYLLAAAGIAMLLVQVYIFLIFIGKVSYDED